MVWAVLNPEKWIIELLVGFSGMERIDPLFVDSSSCFPLVI